MPGRQTVLATGEIYHIFNRSISLLPIFSTSKHCKRAIEVLFYYQNQQPPIKYSDFVNLPVDKRESILQDLKKERKFLVDIIAYCLMPNHFHLLLRQNMEDGISIFMANFSNSYSRYFNTQTNRRGSLFEGRFKAVRIQSQEQIDHVSRYIHLNPYSAYVVKDIKELEKYNYSSLAEYLGKTSKKSCVKNFISCNEKTKYKAFVYDNADYQRQLQNIKHLLFSEVP
jgi:putative transposase